MRKIHEGPADTKSENLEKWRARIEKRAAEIGDLSASVPHPKPEIFISSIEDNIKESRERLAVIEHKVVRPDDVKTFEKAKDLLDDLQRFLNVSQTSQDFRDEIEKDLEGFNDALDKVANMVAYLEEKCG